VSFGIIVKDAILNLIFRGVAYPYVSADQVSLHTANPGDTGTNELVGGSYARQQVAWTPSSGAQVAMTADHDFNGLPPSTVSHFGLWTRFGQFVGSGAFPVPLTVLSGESVRLPAGTTFSLVDV
jgi:hypothetical protein